MNTRKNKLNWKVKARSKTQDNHVIMKDNVHHPGTVRNLRHLSVDRQIDLGIEDRLRTVIKTETYLQIATVRVLLIDIIEIDLCSGGAEHFMQYE